MTDLQNIAREWADGQRKAAMSNDVLEAWRTMLDAAKPDPIKDPAGYALGQAIAALDAERAKVRRLRAVVQSLISCEAPSFECEREAVAALRDTADA